MVDRFPPVRRKVPITSGQVKMQQDCHLLFNGTTREAKWRTAKTHIRRYKSKVTLLQLSKFLKKLTKINLMEKLLKE
jgi:hypothetical protein